MSLPRRFAVLVGALLVATFVTCTAGVFGLDSLERELRATVDVDVARLIHITHTRRLFRSMLVLERDILLETEPTKRALLVAKTGSARRDLAAEIAAYRRVAPSEDSAAIVHLDDAVARWVAINDRVIALLAAGDQAAAQLASGEHVRDPVSWEVTITSLIALGEARLADKVEEAHTTYVVARRLVIGVSVLAALTGLLAGALVFRGIRSAMNRVVEVNANLETIVDERTRALRERERTMKLVLDSTGDGLVLIRRTGEIVGDRSGALLTWFGAALPADGLFATYAFEDATARAIFALGLEQLAEGFLPFEVVAQLMPRTLCRNGATFELAYKEVLDEFTTPGASKILVIVRDITVRIAAERTEREARETQALIAHLLGNAKGFASFVKEGSALIRKVSAPRDAAAQMRDLHTLKGNGYVFGFESLGEVCHELESVVDQEGALAAEHVQRLDAVWTSGMKRLEGFVTRDADALQVSRESYDALLVSLKNREAHEAMVALVESWRRESTGPILRRLAAATERIAGSLGKRVDVQVDDGSVSLPPNVYDELWSSMVHVVRNATHHGIEAPDARALAAKPERGRILLATRIRTDGRLSIEVSDDGRGIDFAALARAAKDRGIAAASEDELLRAMIAGKLSTADAVSEVAGRGVGVSAAVEACERLEGRVHVETEVGCGTRFRFSLPPPLLRAA